MIHRNSPSMCMMCPHDAGRVQGFASIHISDETVQKRLQPSQLQRLYEDSRNARRILHIP